MRKTFGPVRKRNCKAENIQCGGTCLNPTVKTCRLKLSAQTSKSITTIKEKIQPQFPKPEDFQSVESKYGGQERDVFEKFFSQNQGTVTTSIKGDYVSYEILSYGLSGLGYKLSSMNATELEKVYPKMSGKLLDISWSTEYGARDQATPIQIALDAKKVWTEKILPTLEDGTVVANTPKGGAGGARDRAYQRMGFSPVNTAGAQYSIVENGKLKPLNISAFPHAYYLSQLAVVKLKKAEVAAEKSGQEFDIRAEVPKIWAETEQQLIQKYGDWREVQE